MATQEKGKRCLAFLAIWCFSVSLPLRRRLRMVRDAMLAMACWTQLTLGRTNHTCRGRDTSPEGADIAANADTKLAPLRTQPYDCQHQHSPSHSTTVPGFPFLEGTRTTQHFENAPEIHKLPIQQHTRPHGRLQQRKTRPSDGQGGRQVPPPAAKEPLPLAHVVTMMDLR